MTGCSWEQLHLIILVCLSPVMAGEKEPSSVWPLTNKTQGYDVIKDVNTAVLAGAPPFTNHLLADGYRLDGTTHVDISLDARSKFTVVASFSFDDVDAGFLFDYTDGQNHIQCKLSLGQLSFRVNDVWGNNKSDDDKTVKTDVPTDVAVTKKDDEIKLYLFVVEKTSEICKVKVEGTSFETGTLRIGGSLTGDARRAVKGKLSCVRLYQTDSFAGKEMRADCNPIPPNPDKLEDALKVGSQWVYKGPYPCMSSPCRNGGNCSTEGDNTYKCQCVAGYSGMNCEQDIDECASQPCQNEGVCSQDINAFSCACTPYFSGELCETALPRTGSGSMFKLTVGRSPEVDVPPLVTVNGTSDLGCGFVCRKTAMCLSFAVNTISAGSNSCTLYNRSRASLQASPGTRFFVIDPS